MANEIKGVRVNGTLYKIDYPSLANRVFGEETRKAYLEEQANILFTDSNGFYTNDSSMEVPSGFLPIAGGLYVVTWDGNEYECECLEYGNGYSLGDPELIDTPFELQIYLYDRVWIQVRTDSTAARHTFKIDQLQRSRLDPKFLPPYLGFGAEKRTPILTERADVPFTEYVNEM